MNFQNLFVFLCLFFTITKAQTAIPPGTSLYASNPNLTWVSPNNTFYIGFSQVGSSSSYTLSINYNGGVPIWTAGNSTTTVDSEGSFRFLSSGTLSLFNGSGAIVWDSNTAGLGVTTASLDASGNASLNANLSSPTLGIQPTGILSIFDAAFTSGPQVVAYSNDYALTDQCEVFGYCGNMGICSYNESSSSPICDCPSENFEPVDVNDSRQGCKRKAEIDSCPGNATMLEIDNAKFLTYEPELPAQSFLHGNISLPCYSKPPGFISGYRNPALPSTSYVKVCGPAQPSPPPGVLTVENSRSRGLRVWVVCVAVVITLLGLIAVESGLWWWCCRNSPKFDSLSAQYALLEYASEFEKGNVNSILDQRLLDQGVDIEQVTRAIQVSFWCIQEHPSQRPMMGKVVQMLEGISEIERPPPPKAITESSVSGTSIMSSDVSALSTLAASAPAPSSSSSHQTVGVSPLASGRNIDRASSSLLYSDPKLKFIIKHTIPLQYLGTPKENQKRPFQRNQNVAEKVNSSNLQMCERKIATANCQATSNCVKGTLQLLFVEELNPYPTIVVCAYFKVK
ncbi:G-TYPE LECTIN S-RECEPTOR SERINE/THREONINE-PROTEIN KINASE [Salix purpurea]|uniref:non-specific serine/threonine protein kinase n=1 Tax=Salix purpurea TaxID=77065 RepID=A0A9Q0WDZ3_SALPP|nr:G-TYPE LECTIN S-RECEPTOR SERINE/THREONINE-PROTEIN KINASE [Salix purpurea]